MNIDIKSSARTLIVAALLAGAAAAQPPGRGIDMEQMTVLLDLDDYQRSEVERILEEQRAAAMARRDEAQASGARPSREEMQAYRAQAAEDLRTKLQAVLTVEQIEKFEALMPDRGRGFGRRDRREHGE